MILLHTLNIQWIHVLCHFHYDGQELWHTTLPVDKVRCESSKFCVTHKSATEIELIKNIELQTSYLAMQFKCIKLYYE